jgi:DHA2 family multidrug resistance protein
VLGFVLYGSILLLPVLLQQLLGYTATLAGMVLSPGGVLTLIMMPIAGALVARVQAKYLIMLGLGIVAYSMFYMAGFSLQIDFWIAVIARAIQGAGLAFLFVPINAAAFYFVPREKTGQGTAIINLIRNVGGSSGIAFVTTLLARHTQLHQNYLVDRLTPLNPAYNQAVAGIQATLIQQGVSPSQAPVRALGVIYRALNQQAAMLAYDDVFRILGVISLVLIPLMFLLKSVKNRKGEMPAVH